jgi:hypothetical protein
MVKVLFVAIFILVRFVSLEFGAKVSKEARIRKWESIFRHLNL